MIRIWIASYWSVLLIIGMIKSMIDAIMWSILTVIMCIISNIKYRKHFQIFLFYCNRDSILMYNWIEWFNFNDWYIKWKLRICSLWNGVNWMNWIYFSLIIIRQFNVYDSKEYEKKIFCFALFCFKRRNDMKKWKEQKQQRITMPESNRIVQGSWNDCVVWVCVWIVALFDW